jgi:hypothetical protein
VRHVEIDLPLEIGGPGVRRPFGDRLHAQDERRRLDARDRLSYGGGLILTCRVYFSRLLKLCHESLFK